MNYLLNDNNDILISPGYVINKLLYLYVKRGAREPINDEIITRTTELWNNICKIARLSSFQYEKLFKLEYNLTIYNANFIVCDNSNKKEEIQLQIADTINLINEIFNYPQEEE